MANLFVAFTPPSPTPLSYTVRYREVGTTPYTTVTLSDVGGGMVVITGVDINKRYEGFIASNCTGGAKSTEVAWGPIPDQSLPFVFWTHTQTNGATSVVKVFINDVLVAQTTASTSRNINYHDGDTIKITVTSGDLNNNLNTLFVIEDNGVDSNMPSPTFFDWANLAYQFNTVTGAAYSIHTEAENTPKQG